MDFAAQHWDVIVIGTGMGGATAGYALAKAGRRVLFCEQGLDRTVDAGGADGSLRGDYAENLMRGVDQTAAAFRRAGRHADPIEDRSYGAPRAFVPFIGSGAGGSSALYGMALERLSAADFEPRRHHPDAVDAALPDRWPIGIDQMAPWYERAERLFRVTRTASIADDTAPRLVPANRELFDFLRTTKSLHPYALPLACERVDGCKGCQGYLCDRPCKNDSARMCLAPAVAEHAAQVLHACQVIRLESDGDRVTAAWCRVAGRELRLAADLFVLAGGALSTPAVLLNSANAHWPTGLANRSGLVGKYLMRHCIDLYAVAVDTPVSPQANTKELAFNDFYATPTGKFGSVQSFGAMPSPTMMVDSLQQELKEERGAVVAALFAPLKPVLRTVLRRIFARRVVLASVMEDLPYADNAVGIASRPDGTYTLTFRYRLHAHERARVAQFRTLVTRALSPYRTMVLKQAANNRRLAHVCGTCRFGDDPATSVLDRDNRAHGIANLYVVDASFFPSSGGTNPALTVAANALRVAHQIVATVDKDSTATTATGEIHA